MAERNGWWSLDVNVNELSDLDREHIARQIIEGFTSGEIIKDTED